MRPLPIDPLLPELVRTLRESPVLVLTAEPGAGKTTRVPTALLDAGFGDRGVIWVAEPRRLAARLAAEFVARERGESVGRSVGYTVRFDRKASAETKILYATEGVLLNRFAQEPRIPEVSVVVLDEFHERHLSTDLLFVLVDRLRREARPDLRLVVMSATLEADRLAEHLGAPRLRSEGRAFPLTIEHVEKADDRPLEKQVASAVRKVVTEEPEGDVLVFLPGAREIRQSLDALAADAGKSDLLVLPLHGDLPAPEQARAIEPAKSRKVILSTNVAESSVTIDGVTAVIDSGLARVAGHSPWSGLPTLQTAKISRASATQRAGRAGRTRAGRVLRLYSRAELASRPEQDRPEILREDLAEPALVLAAAGVRDPAALRWLDPPPQPALAAAATLLARLSAFEKDGSLSRVGRRLLAFPLPPRLARVVIEGERRGVARDACLAAALLSERDIRQAGRTEIATSGGRRGRAIDASGPSDVLELMDRFREAEDARFDPRRLSVMGIDARTARTVERTRDKLVQLVRDDVEPPATLDDADRAVQQALLAGFPDRLARRRAPSDPGLILFSGKSARLADTSVVREGFLMVTLDAEESSGRIVVRMASSVEPSWIFESFPDLVEMSDDLEWNASSQAVEMISRIRAGSVVIEEERRPAPPSEAASRLLVQSVRKKADFSANEGAGVVLLRLELLRTSLPEANLPELSAETLEAAVADAAVGKTKKSELDGVDVSGAVLASLTHEQRQLLEREAPERITLPGGRSVPVHYEAGKPPWVESRLQDFFGMVKTPALCRGRVPLTVHLLAPNQRAVQVTTDLAGFWERHYPALRRELGRRYPRHPWPEDGRNATPPPPLPPRRK